MNLITVKNLEKSFGDKQLFKSLDLSIHENERIGLIGRNGEGKTSLLKIIAGLEEEDSGEIIYRSGLKIEYLPQNVDYSEDATVLEQVFKGDSPNIKILKSYHEELASEEIDDKKLLALTEEMERKNLWGLESEAKSILTRLGIEDFNKKVGQLSGGQKRRVAIASALISESDLLIMDEPSNHLDNKTIEWLEDYLLERSGALLMVTHDRYFLDRVTNRIIELENSKIYSYSGNYNYYLEKKLERQEMELASERKRQSLYKQELEWMKQGIRARGTRQKARVERFEELGKTSFHQDRAEMDISVSGHRLGRKIIELKDISKYYGDRGVIKNFSYNILRGDRIGILGDNGSGKTSLLNIIAGKLEADSGQLEIGETVKIGYFSQEVQDMDENMRAIEYIKEAGEFIETEDSSRITASQMMERFLFSSKEQWTPIEKLSGGERRRLYLLRVLMEGPNVLLLDEPTNDLDINTLQVLEDYIEEFPGPVIVVSHDRYLLDKIVDKIFYLKDGTIKQYPGNYSDFKEEIDHLENQEIKEVESPKKTEERKSKRSLKFSYNEQREWESIDQEIASLEAKIGEVEKKMDENSSSYSKLEELLEEKTVLDQELNEKLDRWIYLSDLKERIDSQ